MLLISIYTAQKICSVFFDGTTNDKTTGTNVWTMFDNMPGSQVAYSPQGLNKDNVEAYTKSIGEYRSVYVPGVGTSLSGAKNSQSLFGTGIEKRATIGYAYLLNVCEAEWGENYRLKIVGFSRGAVTARMFATYLSKFGIAAINLVSVATFDGSSTFERTFLYPDTVNTVGRVPVITFLGLFDTVASIGSATKRYDPDDPSLQYPEPNFYPRLSLKIPMIVLNCAHAVAINEYRSLFQYTPITLDKSSWVQQYFIGSHGDIGGYMNSKRQQIALSWMSHLGFERALDNLALVENVVFSLRAVPYKSSYAEATITGGVISRSVDWPRIHFTAGQVAQDGNLAKTEDLLNSIWLDQALAASAKLVAIGKKND